MSPSIVPGNVLGAVGDKQIDPAGELRRVVLGGGAGRS